MEMILLPPPTLCRPANAFQLIKAHELTVFMALAKTSNTKIESPEMWSKALE